MTSGWTVALAVVCLVLTVTLIFAVLSLLRHEREELDTKIELFRIHRYYRERLDVAQLMIEQQRESTR
jgi:hypothetical protein